MSEKKRKIYINGTFIEVSEQDYFNYSRDLWAMRKRLQKQGLCCCPKGKLWTCEGVCLDCKHYHDNRSVSLDADYQNNEATDNPVSLHEILTAEPDPETQMLKDLLIREMYELISSLDDEDSKIIKFIMQGVSERDAAEQLGITRYRYRANLARITEELYDALKQFYCF